MSQPPPLPSHAAAALQPAGFWERVIAHLIDGVLWTIILVALAVSLFHRELLAFFQQAMADALGGRIAAPRGSPFPLWFDVGFQFVLPTLILVALWKWRSATPGKMMLGLRVVNAQTGGHLTTGRCVIRALGYIPPLVPLVFLTALLSAPQFPVLLALFGLSLPLTWGFLRILVRPDKRGWHDVWAGSAVVRAR